MTQPDMIFACFSISVKEKRKKEKKKTFHFGSTNISILILTDYIFQV